MMLRTASSIVCSEVASSTDTDSNRGKTHAPLRTDLSSSFRIEPAELGRGANASAHRVFPREDGMCQKEGVVVKFFHPVAEDKAETQLASIAQEVSMFAAVQQHPNIVGFHGFFGATLGVDTWPNMATHALMMEYCGGGDLADYMNSNKCALPENRAKCILRGLLSALAHVHERGIVHRDVKAENIMLNDDGQPQLADFGLACYKSNDDEMSRRCGSPGYAAPELVLGHRYDEKIDVFGAGVVLYLLVTSKLPFWGSDVMSMCRRTIRCNVKFDTAKGREALTDNCKACVLALLHKSASARLAATAALDHTWFHDRCIAYGSEILSDVSTCASGLPSSESRSCDTGGSRDTGSTISRINLSTRYAEVEEIFLQADTPVPCACPVPPQLAKCGQQPFRRKLHELDTSTISSTVPVSEEINESSSSTTERPSESSQRFSLMQFTRDDVMVELPRHPSVAQERRTGQLSCRIRRFSKRGSSVGSSAPKSSARVDISNQVNEKRSTIQAKASSIGSKLSASIASLLPIPARDASNNETPQETIATPPPRESSKLFHRRLWKFGNQDSSPCVSHGPPSTGIDDTNFGRSKEQEERTESSSKSSCEERHSGLSRPFQHSLVQAHRPTR